MVANDIAEYTAEHQSVCEFMVMAVTVLAIVTVASMVPVVVAVSVPVLLPVRPMITVPMIIVAPIIPAMVCFQIRCCSLGTVARAVAVSPLLISYHGRHGCEG